MITVITGSPGAGKTAFVVNELASHSQDRPLFVHAIPGLQIPHEDIYCRSDLCSHCVDVQKGEGALYVEDWPDWAPIGGLIVLDEVQRVWRPRASGAAVPRSVAALETHRHRGLDFYLISQGPHLFDVNVRKLVSRHVHLVSKWAGRYSYEWPECKQDTGSTADAVSRPYKLPSKVFGQYKSAEVHTKHVHKKPLALYAVLGVVPLTLFLGWRVYVSITAKMEPEIAPAKPEAPAVVQVAATPMPTPAPTKGPVPDFQPREAGRPETAPAYDGLYRVSTAPIVIGCVGLPDDCRCYTTKGVRTSVSESWCRAYLRGEVFYPYEPVRPRVPALASSSVSAIVQGQQ